MNELSLYILDIVQNSIKAKSKSVILNITEDLILDQFIIEVIDDGCGMSSEVLSKVTSPFYTSRTTRKVGLGIPLFKELCEICLGNLTITSTVDVGTTLKGTLKHSSIDRPPLGDIVDTVYLLMINDENVEIKYQHTFKDNDVCNSFIIDTKQIKDILSGVSLKEYEIMVWIKDYITSELQNLRRTI